MRNIARKGGPLCGPLWVALVIGCSDAPFDSAAQSVGSPNASLRIAQVAYDTPGEEAFEEFIDLFNGSAVALPLAGWTLGDGSDFWPLPSDLVIPPLSVVSIARERDGFLSLYGRVPDADGLGLFLDNGGDLVTVTDPQGNLIDVVAWQWCVPGWTLYSPQGDSLVRIDPRGDWGQAADWTTRSPAAPAGGK